MNDYKLEELDEVTPEPVVYVQKEVVVPVVKEKKTGFFKRLMAVTLSLVLVAGSLGLGFGLGRTVNNINNKPDEDVVISANSDVKDSNKNDKEVVENKEDLSYNSVIMSAIDKSNFSVSPIIKNVKDAVVSINVETVQEETENFFGYSMPSMPQVSAGSGIIFQEDSEKIYVVTNYHVISQATKNSTVTISLDDVNAVSANYVGGNEANDIAVISVLKSALENAGLTNYKIAEFADSEKVEIGDFVIAIGNSAGEGKSSTFGMISAQNKTITVDNKSINVIQTDAAINPGNSGGALVNGNGDVIGINTAKISSRSYYNVEGMGYAIPSNDVIKIVDEIMNVPEKTQTPALGIKGGTITDEMIEEYGFVTKGFLISEVLEGSVAANVGLKPYDIIIGFNGVEITTYEDLKPEIEKTSFGDEITISVLRNNKFKIVFTTTMQPNAPDKIDF